MLNLKEFKSLDVLDKLQGTIHILRKHLWGEGVRKLQFFLTFSTKDTFINWEGGSKNVLTYYMNGPQGLWVSQNSEVLYVLAARITFICAMTFEAFPLDVQTCLFQVSPIQ